MAELLEVPEASEQPRDAEPGELARRRFFVGGAALAGATIASMAAPEPASAGHDVNIAYDSQTVFHLDSVNTTSGSSRISSNVSGTAAFVALNNYPVGISRPDGMLGRTTYTTSNCAGVAGACEAASGGTGVLGTCNNATGTGVHGYSGSSVPFLTPPAGTGVFGSGPVNGLVGEARNSGGTGLRATATDGIAVHGVATGGVAGRFEGATEVVGALTTQTLAATGVTATTVSATRVVTERLRVTESSGRARTKKATRTLVVSGVPVGTGSLVVATLQKPVRGVYVAAAVPLAKTDRVKIFFNKRAPKGTVVGWVVVN